MGGIKLQLFDCFAVDSETAIAFLIIGCIIFLLSLIHIAANPFCYPYFYYTFDVTGKRNINIEDCIEQFLCNQCNWRNVYSHQQLIECWKRNQQRYLETCSFKKLRLKQYNKTVNDINAFCFVATRNQTRYRQRNYVKTSYSTSVVVARYNVSWQWLLDRHNLLAQIGFESTLKEYYAHNQRSMMTKALRRQIMQRDNYTCKICGKQMFDEVGLQIDHIIPIVKGGKTVPSNLRVLCSKCNARKGSK